MDIKLFQAQSITFLYLKLSFISVFDFNTLEEMQLLRSAMITTQKHRFSSFRYCNLARLSHANTALPDASW